MQLFKRTPSGPELINIVGQSFARGIKQLVLDARFMHGQITEDEWKRQSVEVGIAGDTSGMSIRQDAGTEPPSKTRD